MLRRSSNALRSESLPYQPLTELMTPDATLLAEFRSQVSKLLQKKEREWEASRRLLETGRLGSTLRRLIEEADRADLPTIVRNTLGTALRHGTAERMQDLSGARLKELTGLPPSKAVRALCVWFELVEIPASSWSVPALDADSIEVFLRDHENPFDLLLTSDIASVLDLGAGDLSFAAELADQYVPLLRQRNRTLVLHAVDRLCPQSKLGGPLHPDQDRLQELRARAGLSFQFFGDQDMCALEPLDQSGRLASHYAIATCWAPATPTFAFEPTRLSPDLVQAELRRTKGAFHLTQYAGERALEVRHGERALLFPPWKFEIRGPLALLEALCRRGRICILGAVDNQVFWELLAQLFEDDRFRPAETLFTAETIPHVFGDVYRKLSALSIGETVDLSTCGTLRSRVSLGHSQTSCPFSFGFHSIRVRRGATFPRIPASSTARRFGDMVDEPTPWMVILVPKV